MTSRTVPTTIALFVALSLAACSGNVTELAVGDCFDAGDGATEITDVTMVDCVEPHDNEVVHVYDLAGDEYPGEDAILADAEESCVAAFEGYVGTDYASSRLEVFPLIPSADAWETLDDRAVVCAVRDLEMEQLTGSVRDSGE